MRRNSHIKTFSFFLNNVFESNESWSFKNFSGQGKQSVLMTVRQCKVFCCVERAREINNVGLRKSPD